MAAIIAGKEKQGLGQGLGACTDIGLRPLMDPTSPHE
jgi:hypothetical protein